MSTVPYYSKALDALAPFHDEPDLSAKLARLEVEYTKRFGVPPTAFIRSPGNKSIGIIHTPGPV
jgi:hypothetical protein